MSGCCSWLPEGAGIGVTEPADALHMHTRSISAAPGMYESMKQDTAGSRECEHVEGPQKDEGMSPLHRTKARTPFYPHGTPLACPCGAER